MMYPLLADLVLIIHLTFVVFVLCGGLLVLKWRWIAWLHLPAAIWGVVVEFTGWICPLTPLENWLRVQGGEAGYEDDFTTRYLLPILYPVDLIRDIQLLLGTVVIAVNAGMYCWLWRTQARGAARNR
jgi:hypothetical protein